MRWATARRWFMGAFLVGAVFATTMATCGASRTVHDIGTYSGLRWIMERLP